MILLRGSNLLFLKPKKVAGTSFEIALSRYAGPNDIITPISHEDEKVRSALGFGGPKNYKKPIFQWSPSDIYRRLRFGSIPEKFFNHMPAKLARDRISERKFDSTYKISIVRNPYDIVVSRFFWRAKVLEISHHEIGAWLAQSESTFNRNYEQYFIDGECVIDFFIRYEHFEEDIQRLEGEIEDVRGLWSTFMSISAKKSVRPREATAAAILSPYPDIVESIKVRNQDIIERFGYKLE